MDLFNADVYGNIRRVQGLVRSVAKELQTRGRECASSYMEAAIAQMRHFDKVRVSYFQMLMAQARHHKPDPQTPRGRLSGFRVIPYFVMSAALVTRWIPSHHTQLKP